MCVFLLYKQKTAYDLRISDWSSDVCPSDLRVEPGQVVGSVASEEGGSSAAGNRPGVDYYETDITIEELIDIMFEDLELPELERKKLREIPVAHGTRRLGYRRAGIRTHLDKTRTARSRLRRRVATGTAALAQIGRAPCGESGCPYV